MSQQCMRVFSTAFKESAVLRLGAGERLAEVARELGIARKLLYEWRAAYRRPSAGDGTAVRIVRFLAREIESSGGRLTEHPMSSEVFPRRESGHLERSRKWSHGHAIL
jgi:transposase-like protein